MDQAIKLKVDGTNSERLYEKRRAEYKAKYREVKRQIRRDKRNWTDWIAKEAEEAANKQQMMTLYNLTQTLCNEKPRQSTAVNNREETADPEPGNDCITALKRATEGKREKGWPNTTWRDTVERERSRPWWQSWSEMRSATQNKNRWRTSVEALCATLAQRR